MRSRLSSWAAGALAAALALPACGGDGGGGGTGPPAQSISIALAPLALTIGQGQSGSTDVTLVRRGGFTGAVTLALAGAPAGVTPAFSPATIPTGATASVLTLSVAATAEPGTYTVYVRASGNGVTEQSIALTLKVVATGFTLAVEPATVGVVQGGTGSAVATITRAPGFVDQVTLTVTGGTTGITVTPSPFELTGASAPLAIAVGANVPPGSYGFTLTATAPSAATQTAAFTVAVTAAAGNRVTVQFCGEDVPIWLASRTDGGEWTRVTAGAGNTFGFDVGARGAVAVAMRWGSEYELTVVHATAGELMAIGTASTTACAAPASGDRQLTGSMAGLTGTQTASVAMGDAWATLSAGGPTAFTLSGAPNRAADLVAVQEQLTETELAAQRIIIRRDVSPAATTIPLLDFGSAEAYAMRRDPENDFFQVLDLRGDDNLVSMVLTTRGGTTAALFLSASRPSYLVPQVPTPPFATGEMYRLVVLASPPSDPTTMRGGLEVLPAVGFMGVPLGPTLASPTISAVSAGTAPLRARVQLPVQAQYAGSVSASFYQEVGAAVSRSVQVLATRDYMGGASAWDLTIPDLAAAGFDPSWGLQPGTALSWEVSAYSTDLLELLGYSGQRQLVDQMFAARGSPGTSVLASRAPALSGRRGGTLAALRAVQQQRARLHAPRER